LPIRGLDLPLQGSLFVRLGRFGELFVRERAFSQPGRPCDMPFLFLFSHRSHKIDKILDLNIRDLKRGKKPFIIH
jgi:hypothetical protein